MNDPLKKPASIPLAKAEVALERFMDLCKRGIIEPFDKMTELMIGAQHLAFAWEPSDYAYIFDVIVDGTRSRLKRYFRECLAELETSECGRVADKWPERRCSHE